MAAGPGASTPYDWDGMTVALVQRIHDRGLPSTQAELIAEMQDWFAEQSDGKKMPDSRSMNLSNAVSVVVYEAWRQLGYPGAILRS